MLTMASLENHIATLVEARTPPQTKILLMALGGSRGKKLSSEDTDSDYDAKVVVMFPKNYYLLQKGKDTSKMQAHEASKYASTDCELDIISVLKFIQWCVESNQAAFDILFSPIHLTKDDEKVDELKALFLKHFRPVYTMVSLAKQMRVEKDQCLKRNGALNFKIAMNMVYYQMRRTYIERHQSVPPMDVEALIKEQDEDTQLWIKDLLRMRKTGKYITFDGSLFPKFEEFTYVPVDEKNTREVTQKEAIEEGENLFLKYCDLEQK